MDPIGDVRSSVGGEEGWGINSSNVRILFVTWFCWQIYRLYCYFTRKPTNYRGNIKELDGAADYFKFVESTKKSKKTVSVLYYMRHTKFSGGCKLASPVVAEMSLQYSDTPFCSLDVDTTNENMAIVKSFGIKKVPHLQLYQDGKVVEIADGIHGYKAIEGWMEKYGCEAKPITQQEADAQQEAEEEAKKDQ